MLHLTVLGSGSSGNAAVVAVDGQPGGILIDAGLSAKQLGLRLSAVGVGPEALSGILLTHEHGDHTRGLDVFCHRYELPVFCTPPTRAVLADTLGRPKRWQLIPNGSGFEIGAISVVAFSVPHDAVDPVGFVLKDADSSIGFVSDTGHVTGIMRDHLRGVNTLFIEANYDEDMLEKDEKRPWSTKQRISARHGHLSNDQMAAFLHDVATSSLHRVVLGHLSEDCNDPELACTVARQALGEAGFSGVHVGCAGRETPISLPVAACAPSSTSVRDERSTNAVLPVVQGELFSL